MWRKFRIALLLFILATVAQQEWLADNDLRWRDSLYVAVYPVNADHSNQVSSYIQTLSRADFAPVVEYFAEQSQRYGLAVRRPFEIEFGSEVAAMPPAVPQPAALPKVLLWSLQFRWWAWRNGPPVLVKPQIRLYLLFHDPQQVHVLSHSTALNKGRIGLVNLFGEHSYAGTNAVVIAHELLHTVGATDKYDLADNIPRYPDGYADPHRQPRYPQEHAELMAGRIPLSASRAQMPAGLAQTLIGEATAREIRWVKPH